MKRLFGIALLGASIITIQTSRASEKMSLDQLLEKGNPEATLTELKDKDPESFKSICAEISSNENAFREKAQSKNLGALKQARIISSCTSGFGEQAKITGTITQKPKQTEAPKEPVKLNVSGLCEGGVCTEAEASQILKATGTVQGRYEKVDVSTSDPKMAISMSNSILEHGIPHFLTGPEAYNLQGYTKDKELIETAKKMADVFSKGQLFKPQGNDLQNQNLKKNVGAVYDIVLQHFLWENGHTTEVNSIEAAAVFVLRARIEALKRLWTK